MSSIPMTLQTAEPIKITSIITGLVTKFLVQKQLLDVSSNGGEYAIKNETFVATLTPGDGLTIDSVIVSMNDTDITATAWNSSTSKVTVENVSADIIIVASAVTTPDTITLTDVDSAYRSKLETVVASVNDGGLYDFYFCVITDPHSANPSTNKSQNIARYLLKNSKANKLFLLGDYCAINWSNAEWESFSAPFADCIPKVYVTLGNHEYFGGSATDRAAIVAEYLTPKTYLHGSLSDFYYYFDDSVHKIRYIVINTSDGSTNNVSATQLTWLNSAVQVPSAEWGIVAFGHFPLYRPTETSDNVSGERYDIRDALLSTNGTIIAYICGHMHSESVDVLDYSFYQIICNNDSGGKDICYVFGVNTEDKTIDLIHIGSVGTDDVIDYDDLPTKVTRTITNTLTGCTTSNSATSIINGRPYSASLTASANYDLDQGTVSVTMGGVDITSTAYNSSNHAISIDSVTGNVVITATALYIEPIVEYTPVGWTRDTTKIYPLYTTTAADIASAAENFPEYLSFIMCNQETSFPTGYRTGSDACYKARTAAWTSYDYWIRGSNDTANSISAVTYNNKKYCYVTFYKSESDAAYAARQAAIEGGQIGTGGTIKLLSSKTLDANFEFWVLNQNVTADNITSIIPRLPVHT